MRTGTAGRGVKGRAALGNGSEIDALAARIGRLILVSPSANRLAVLGESFHGMIPPVDTENRSIISNLQGMGVAEYSLSP